MPLYERLKEHLCVVPSCRGRNTCAGARSRRGRTKTGYFWSMARDDSLRRNGSAGRSYTYAPAGEVCISTRCSRTIVASCNPTATRLTRSCRPSASPRPFAGPMCAGPSSRSRAKAMRPLQRRLLRIAQLYKIKTVSGGKSPGAASRAPGGSAPHVIALKSSSKNSSPASPENRLSPMRSATRSTIGKD